MSTSDLPIGPPSGTFLIKNVAFPTQFMDVPGDTSTPGNKVCGLHNDGTLAQYWTVTKEGDVYTLTCAGTSTNLDAPDASIGQAVVTDNNLQTFKIYGANGKYQILLTDSDLAVSLPNGNDWTDLVLATSIASNEQQLWYFEPQ